MTGTGVLGFDEDASGRLSRYLDSVRKELDHIDSKERTAILEEIEGALTEKAEFTAKDKDMKTIDGPTFELVLDGFGGPAELAREYSKVAKADPGRLMKAISLFEGFWAVPIFLIGAFLLINVLVYWFPDDVLVCYGQAVLGLFYIAGSTSIFVLIWVQLKDQLARPDIGPFNMIVTLAIGMAGVSTVNIDRDYLLPGVAGNVVGNLLTVMAGILLIGCVWGFGALVVSRRKEISQDMDGQIRPRPWFRPKSKKVFQGTTMILVGLLVLANGLLYLGGGAGNTGPKEGDRQFIGAEPVGGPYNASIEHWTGFWHGEWWDYYTIVYTYNGSVINGSIQLEMRPALDWIRANTTLNDTVVAWWDYGHAIRGYAGRDAAIYMTSKNFVDTIADRNKSGRPWESEEKVRTVSEILLSQDETQLRQGMSYFNASYILTTQRDSSGIAYAVLLGAGKNPDDYLRTENGIYFPKDSAKDMLLFKLWAGGDFNGTRVVYRDINTIILELI